MVTRVINPGFPESGYPGKLVIFQTQKPRFWAVQKPRFSSLAFLPLFNANDIFLKLKWIKKTYVLLYFCYVITSGPTDRVVLRINTSIFFAISILYFPF